MNTEKHLIVGMGTLLQGKDTVTAKEYLLVCKGNYIPITIDLWKSLPVDFFLRQFAETAYFMLILRYS
jgi:hypothetical protein